MNKNLVQMMVLAIVLLAGLKMTANAQLCGCDTSASPNISGRVTDSNGNGVEGIEIWALRQPDDAVLATFTDENGYYGFHKATRGFNGLYPPNNLPIEYCTFYNVGPKLGGTNPLSLGIATNKTESFCTDYENVNFVLTSGEVSAIEKLITGIFTN